MDLSQKTPESGMLHIYTGDGKGKTTAALGLALRAAGSGLNVLVIQFDKCPDDEQYYMERKALEHLDRIQFKATGVNRMLNNGKFRFGVTTEDIEEAKRGLAESRKAIESGGYGLIILDEIITALSYGLIFEDDLRKIISLWRERGRHPELVLTGRGAPDWLINISDLVTEMRKVKHYFDKGVNARIGIEF